MGNNDWVYRFLEENGWEDSPEEKAAKDKMRIAEIEGDLEAHEEASKELRAIHEDAKRRLGG